MHANQVALEAEIARQDEAFAELFRELNALPADTEVAVAGEWLDALSEAASVHGSPLASLNGSMRA